MPAERIKTKFGFRWRYRGQYQGIQYRSPSIYATKQEALLAEKRHVLEIDEELKNPKKDMKLLDLMTFRLDQLQLKKSKKYYKENKRYFKMLLDRLGNVNVSEITRQQIDSFLNDFSRDLIGRGRTNHKGNACLRYLKALFFYGCRIHELQNNPCVGLEFFPIDKKLKYIPSDEDIDGVLKLCDQEEALLVRFVMDTGARINEALRLTPKEIFDDYVVLYTRKSKNSNLIPRKVPRPEYFTDFKGFTRWGEHPRFLEKYVKKLKQETWNWHNLRHRFASKLSKEGRPLFEIMALLGHSNLSTTQNYLQLLP